MRLGAIVVLFEPDLLVVSKELKGLSEQVDQLLFVDNSERDNSSVLSSFPNAIYIPMGENKGIAAAQNRGIVYFMEQQYDFVFFSDQDSCIPNGFVKSLYDAYIRLSANYNLAAIGPIPLNKHTKKPYFNKTYIKNELTDKNVKFWLVDSVMSSCSMAALSNFNEVGLFEEELFIDGVDDEWGWRASVFYNKVNVIVPHLEILHELGNYKSVFGMNLNISSPFRLYFQIRNLIWLSKRNYSPQKWKRNNLFKMVVKIFVYPIFFRPRLKYLNNIIRGVKDGILS